MKYILTIFIASILIISCNSDNNKTHDNTENNIEIKKEKGINIGKIDDNSASATLSISLEKAGKLMLKNNRLTSNQFVYTYTRAWIEVIQIKKGKYSYFLGVEASLASKNNQQAYSCYSIYTELETNSNELIYYPSSVQHSCTGKCCGSCKLVIFENGLDCECSVPSNESECKGNGKCKHTASEKLSDEQIKSEII